MNLDLALKIFTLGVKFGIHQAKLGFEPDKMQAQEAAEILHQGFQENVVEINDHLRQLLKLKQQLSWYTQFWTAKDSYRFGLMAGFAEAETTKPDKKGVKLLTEDVIDKLTQNQFRNARPETE